jgi:hypothetical protein
VCVFAHSRFIENPPIWSWETNPSFLRWFCHSTPPGRSPKWRDLAQKIVASSVLPITEILAIENDKLNITFLHIAFESQSLLKPTGDQTDSSTNWRTREGDQRRGEWEQIKIPQWNLAYIPKMTRGLSLLAQPRPASYRSVIGPRNRTRSRSRNTERC